MRKTAFARRIAALLFALAMVFSMAACGAGSEDVDPVENAKNGVVRVVALIEDSDGNISGYGTGSGFGIGTAGEETDYFVTNWHVVTLAGEYNVGALPVYIATDDNFITYTGEVGHIDFSKLIQCTVVYAADEYPDVAILKADKKVPGRIALPLKSAQEVSTTETVYAIGYPGAADDTAYNDATGESGLYGSVEHVTMFSGTISKFATFALFGDTYCIEHSAHINHGNSGGPLVDENGAVIGINTYGLTEDDAFNYSVYVDYAMGYLKDMGISYDVYEPETFPVLQVVLGASAAVCVVVLIIILVLKAKKRKDTEDSGMRVQYSPDAMLSNQRLVIAGTLRFGRDEDCNVRYPAGAPGISGHHCEITVEKGVIYLRDLNSTYGTYVNGQRIIANTSVPLTVGTKVSLGTQKEQFQIVKSTTARK